jgi:anti-sigma B factor antagonist
MISESSVRTIEPDVKVFAISGRLNLGNALMSLESAIRRLIAEGTRKLIVDLSGLDHIDSSGIGVLVMSNAEMERAGGRMRVAGARGLVAKSLEIVHFDRLAGLDADVESACRNLG